MTIAALAIDDAHVGTGHTVSLRYCTGLDLHFDALSAGLVGATVDRSAPVTARWPIELLLGVAPADLPAGPISTNAADLPGAGSELRTTLGHLAVLLDLAKAVPVPSGYRLWWWSDAAARAAEAGSLRLTTACAMLAVHALKGDGATRAGRNVVSHGVDRASRAIDDLIDVVRDLGGGHAGFPAEALALRRALDAPRDDLDIAAVSQAVRLRGAAPDWSPPSTASVGVAIDPTTVDTRIVDPTRPMWVTSGPMWQVVIPLHPVNLRRGADEDDPVLSGPKGHLRPLDRQPEDIALKLKVAVDAGVRPADLRLGRSRLDGDTGSAPDRAAWVARYQAHLDRSGPDPSAPPFLTEELLGALQGTHLR